MKKKRWLKSWEVFEGKWILEWRFRWTTQQKTGRKKRLNKCKIPPYSRRKHNINAKIRKSAFFSYFWKRKSKNHVLQNAPILLQKIRKITFCKTTIFLFEKRSYIANIWITIHMNNCSYVIQTKNPFSKTPQNPKPTHKKFCSEKRQNPIDKQVMIC